MAFKFLTQSLLLINCWSFSFSFRKLTGLSSLQLKNYVQEQLSNNHTSLGYKHARKLLLDYDRIDIYQPEEHSKCTFLKVPYRSYTKINKQSHKFNIEHIYPQSKSSRQRALKSDLHNIFVCDSLLNQHRSNYKFGDYDSYQDRLDQLIFLDSSGNEIKRPQSNLDSVCAKDNRRLVFIPTASSRGIISRSLAYICLRYNLRLDKVIIDNQLIAKWNQQFPPRQSEHIRNFWIHHFQGNRNIFIDQPDLISTIFPNDYP